MNKLYLLGGPIRSAKSTIMEGIVQKQPMHLVATDAVQQGVRSLFVDDPFQILNKVSYKGSAEYKLRDTKEVVKSGFSREGNEVQLAQQVIIGMLDHFRRNLLDVAMEGLHITPDWVHSLKLEGYDIKAAFVGFTNPDHTKNIVEYARSNEHDWINEWLVRHNNDEARLREWMASVAEENVRTAKRAVELGFPYFDISTQPFEDYVSAVQKYFLGV